MLPLGFLPALVAASWSYGIIADCGSTGTRVYIYKWSDTEPLTEFIPVKQEDEDLLSKTPGISSFTGRPRDEIVSYFAPLLAQAARWVPAEAQPLTTVRALGTAGMRLLSEEEQTPIWAGIDAAIAASDFKFEVGNSQTLGGEYEGIFLWLAMSLIRERAPEAAPSALFGGLDLGGASTQITFPPASGVILGDAFRLLVNGSATRLYSHSYMRSGQNQAIQRYAQALSDHDGCPAAFAALSSPCGNPGLDTNVTVSCAPQGGPAQCVRRLVGTGDWSACKAHTNALLGLDNECLLHPCAAHGVYQPPLVQVTLYGVSAFFYTAYGLGLVAWDEAKGISTEQLEAAGRGFCAANWSSVAADPHAHVYCFASAYIPSLLDAYSVPRASTTSVLYTRKIEGFAASWALGAQLFFMEQSRCEIEASGRPGGDAPRCAHNETGADGAARTHIARLEVAVFAGVPTALLLGLLLGVALLRCRDERQAGSKALAPPFVQMPAEGPQQTEGV